MECFVWYPLTKNVTGVNTGMSVSAEIQTQKNKCKAMFVRHYIGQRFLAPCEKVWTPILYVTFHIFSPMFRLHLENFFIRIKS